MTEVEIKLDDLQDEPLEESTTTETKSTEGLDESSTDPAMEASFMSESIYEKISSAPSRSLRHKSISMLAAALSNLKI